MDSSQRGTYLFKKLSFQGQIPQSVGSEGRGTWLTVYSAGDPWTMEGKCFFSFYASLDSLMAFGKNVGEGEKIILFLKLGMSVYICPWWRKLIFNILASAQAAFLHIEHSLGACKNLISSSLEALIHIPKYKDCAGFGAKRNQVLWWVCLLCALDSTRLISKSRVEESDGPFWKLLWYLIRTFISLLFSSLSQFFQLFLSLCFLLHFL